MLVEALANYWDSQYELFVLSLHLAEQISIEKKIKEQSHMTNIDKSTSHMTNIDKITKSHDKY